MSSYALFQMWEPFRQSLIKKHLFYVEQARKRLLSQFDNIEADAERAVEKWLRQNEQHFDPDRYDSSDFYEAASNVGIEFYKLLSNMHEQTRLSVVAGMFCEWDKQLRDWLVHEIKHWHHGDNAIVKVWSADFGQIADLLENLGLNVRGTDYFCRLDACRLVVNVYKHGDGKSFDELKNRFPEYLGDLFDSSGSTFLGTKYRDHTHRKVNDDHFQVFSDAILSFWQDVPDNVFNSEVIYVPDWFGKAIMEDQVNPQQASKK